MEQRNKRSYNRLTQKLKDQLIYLVLKESLKIIEAAKQLGLKYAAAKTIMVMHKRKQRSNLTQVTNVNRCGVKKKESQAIQIELICCIFGEIISKKVV